MLLNFTKMHGLGNDFVVVDATQSAFSLNRETIKYLSNRHTGVGFDQLLVVEPPNSQDVEFTYRIFNADGGEVEQCGNGARCFAQFVREKRLTTNDVIHVSTQGGKISLSIQKDGQITVNMGIPNFDPKQIPLSISSRQESYSLENNQEIFSFSAVSMGNPHAVLTISDNLFEHDIEPIGQLFQSSPLFPSSVNVGFMQIINENQLNLRVYERGVGETQACGTGACAAAVCAMQQNLVNNNDVTVTLKGGDLNIHWEGEGTPVMMTGSATTVFEGTIEV